MHVLAQVQNSISAHLDESSVSSYLSTSHNAAFFRSIAAEFPSLLDILCFKAVNQHQRQAILELQQSIYFLCMCMKWAGKQVQETLTG